MRLDEIEDSSNPEEAEEWFKKKLMGGQDMQFSVKNGKLTLAKTNRLIAFNHTVKSCPYSIDMNWNRFGLLDLESVKNLDHFIIPENIIELLIENCPELSSIVGLENMFNESSLTLEKLAITDLKGLPEELNGLWIEGCRELRSFGPSTLKKASNVKIKDCTKFDSIEFLPEEMYAITFENTPMLKSLAGIHKFAKKIDKINFIGDIDIQSNILGLIKIKHKEINEVRVRNEKFKKALYIIKRHDEVSEAQQELIEEGLQEYAKL